MFCLSTKEKEEKFAWKQMKVNDLYEKHIRHLVLNARDLPEARCPARRMLVNARE